MKRFFRALCAALALAVGLSACSLGSTPSSSSSKTPSPSTQPLPVIADINRPLPVLPEKKVTGTPGEAELVLVQDGVANAAIVVPLGHAKAITAAADLNLYFEKMTGTKLPVYTDDQSLPEGNLILVGPTKQTFALGVSLLTGYPKSESFLIRRQGSCLILYGNDDGTYYGTQGAVNRFLEEAGCGWFTVDALWQVVPELPTLAVSDWDQTFRPYFTSRTMSGISNAMASRWNLGGDSHRVGHGLASLVGKNYTQTHPEWYAEIGGVRPAVAGWYQFCYTSESLADFVAQQIIALFDRNQNLCNYSIAANDGWDEGWCECDACTAAGNCSDQMLVFANRVAEKVAQVHPDKTLSILAYHATFLPPLHTTAHPNVEIMFCMETNPFTDPTLDYVVHQGLNGTTKVFYTQSWQDNCKQYIEQTNLQTASIWTWLCISTNSYAWYGAPWVQGNTISRTYDLYREMGVERVFADCGKELDWLRWPLHYIYARCMWDDTVDAETHLYDACKKLYGAAADEVFLYYRLLSDCAAICVDDGGITWVPSRIGMVYSAYVLEIRQAVEQIRTKQSLLTPEEQERVELLFNAWSYTDKNR